LGFGWESEVEDHFVECGEGLGEREGWIGSDVDWGARKGARKGVEERWVVGVGKTQQWKTCQGIAVACFQLKGAIGT